MKKMTFALLLLLFHYWNANASEQNEDFKPEARHFYPTQSESILDIENQEFRVWSKEDRRKEQSDNIVTSTKRIDLPQFPGAFNPSLIKVKEGFLLSFRYYPDQSQLWISKIGIVLLDDNLAPVSEPVLLDTRIGNSKIPSQSEDARLFSCNGNIYLIYNDNTSCINPTIRERRDMFVTQLFYTDGEFFLSMPIKLIHEYKYFSQTWQKNWVPFEWNGSLLLSYSISPHEVLYPDCKSGLCQSLFETHPKINWSWGTLRGGTPALLVDGEYLGFFHSSCVTATAATNGHRMWHYFMGAYTFSSSPPFELTKISTAPIIGKDFYTKSSYNKRVVFPGGFAVVDSSIYVAYGKDDCEIWIATLDKEKLKKSMTSLK